jgi:hypothetical protein
MSNNVISLFGLRKKPERKSLPSDTSSLALFIANWAEEQGVDIYDVAFQIRCADFITHLQIMASDGMRKTG